MNRLTINEPEKIGIYLLLHNFCQHHCHDDIRIRFFNILWGIGYVSGRNRAGIR